MSTPIVDTHANKAVYGGLSVALVQIIAETLKWAWPATEQLLTPTYTTLFASVITGLAVYFTPNSKNGATP